MKKIILSRLFKTYKKGSHGIIKFNLITNQSKNDYIALGGITQKNHKKTNLINIKGYALSSELKFKPRFLRPILILFSLKNNKKKSRLFLTGFKF